MKVKATINFNDLTENTKRVIGDVFECSKTRAEFLVEHNAVEILEEEKVEDKIEHIEEEKPLKVEFKKSKKKKNKR